MREIKFRAFVGDKFYYFHVGGFWTDSQREIYNSIILNGIEFQEFIGIHDKNGKEIYEGDIVSYNYLNNLLKSVVQWDDKRATFYFGANKFNGDGFVEIIGNVHENLELLKC